MLGLPPPPRLMTARLILGRASAPLVLVPNPLLLKARKNFDLSTDCIHLLSSEKYKKLNGKTIKLLLSQHTKKNPFGKISLGAKVPPLAKIIGRNVKSFSYHTDNQNSALLKPETRLLKLVAHSYKHLECLDVSKLDFQNRSSYHNISKLNHLQSLNMRLQTGKIMPGPRFLQNLKHLRHLTLSITESSQNKHIDLVDLTGFLYNLALLPSLESYNIDIRTTISDKNEQFVGTLLYYISLLKAKRFCVKLQCSEDIALKVEMFSSLLESIDTLEYKHARDAPSLNEPVNFQVPTSRKLILLLRSSQRKQSFSYIINACNSLEHLYLEESQIEGLLTTLVLPQTLKTLTLRLTRIPSPKHQSNSWEKLWENGLSSLKNLENLGLIVHNPDKATQQWINRLPQLMPLKSLKRYHLKLREDALLRKGEETEYFSFLTEWAQSLKDLNNLESLSLDINFPIVSSLDFFTEALASLQQLKRIKLDLTLNSAQTKEALKFTIPPQNLPKLEHIWLGFSQYVLKESAAKLLRDIVNCENLQSLNVSGHAFDEETAISILKKLAHLKTLQIETNARHTLRLNSKKELVKCKPMLV